MRWSLGSTLAATPLLALSVVARAGEDRVYTPDLWRVERICVGDMGQSDEAARFRLLLEEELAKQKFTVVSQPEQADGVLTGVVTVRVYEDTSVARATVQLRAPSGERLWGGDFEPRRAMFKKVKDTVKFRAQNIAEDLRKDWNKAAKAAGQPQKKT
jgi:hypothetical protein